MRSADLRRRFLDFFKEQGHVVRPSDSLIPSGDPTVLFTSAGMNQFKDYFLGKRTDVKRAASCQKCLRTGDLDKVGKSPSHHSFFEMLGNFSFGDYFKREAIGWAWEFLTGTLDFSGKQQSTHPTLCLGLPGQKLWVSIYEDDEEAFRLWRELGVPEARIRRFGQADNFWPANAPTEGPNGPCGPCSEIYYDPDGAVQGPNSVEMWNLVFTQFDRQPDGTLKPLPKPNIDTGMGLERLARVLQGVETDYETDLFAPIMAAIRALGRGEKVKLDRVVFAERAIADHIRAIVFLIAEGLLPSNESRGYVLRMLIRRAYRLGRIDLNRSTSTTRTFLASLVESVEEALRDTPYEAMLTKQRDVIQQTMRHEEMLFVATLEAGTARLDELMAVAKGRVIAGEEAFKLYDTYGFPLELTTDIASERGFEVDRAGFERLLKAQQERSRASSQFGGEVFVPTTLKLDDDGRSEFIGYEALQADAIVKGIWKHDRWAQKAEAGDEVGIVLDRSPFYGESGGQVGDQGAIECLHGHLAVINATWVDQLLVHHVQVREGSVAVNEPVRAKVDPARRLKVARSHTATHLLHWALRKVLGPEAVQAGSLVEAERVRFDFSSLGGLQEEQRVQAERLVNDRIRAADTVQTGVMPLEQAKRAGALALFGEKYGQQVRVVSIGDYSKELCGGTHLMHTGSVGLFRIVSDSAIAAGTRRIEAVVGEAAVERQQQESQWLHQVAQRLSRPPHEALRGLEELFEQLKQAEKQMAALTTELARVQAKDLVAKAQRIDGALWVTAHLDGADRALLAALADALKGQLGSGAALLVSAESAKTVAWVMVVTPDVVKRGVHAGQFVKAVSAITGGGGGGRPDFAQAGGKEPAKIAEALKRAEQMIREALHS